MTDHSLLLAPSSIRSLKRQGFWQLRLPLPGLAEAPSGPHPSIPWRSGDRIWVKEAENMQRAESRLTLHVYGARAERLQQITKEDALASGVRRVLINMELGYTGLEGADADEAPPTVWSNACDAFAELWDAEHSDGIAGTRWADNPVVAALSVMWVKENIDEGAQVAKSGLTATPLSERLAKLSSAASKGEWAYRPQELDDWGMVRSAPLPNGRAPLALVSKSVDDRSHDQHRAAGTDPYEANGVFVVELVNAYRTGRLKVVG